MKNKTERKVGADLTEGSVWSALLFFAVPIVLTNMVQQLYSTVDLVIIGKFVGNIGTVGVSTGGELSDLATSIATAFGTAGQIYIAQLSGAKDYPNLKTAISTLITFLLGISILSATGTIFFCRQILGLLSCPVEAFAEATQYMIITALGMPFVFAYNGICAILRGLGESKRPLFFIIIAATVNIALDLILVVLFDMGAAGTAIATVASQAGSCLAALLYMYRQQEHLRFKWSKAVLGIQRHALGVILSLGIPQLVRVVSVQFSMLWVKSNINTYGLTASTTYSVGNKIEKFMNVFAQGIDGASGAMIGQNLGARRYDRVVRVVKATLISALCVASVVSCIFWLAPRMLYSIFISDTAVIEYGVVFLRIMSIASIVSAFSFTFKAVVTGSGAAYLCLLLGVMDGICRILICIVFSASLHTGASDYFWGAAFCQLVPGIISLVYFMRGRWKSRKLLSEK